MQYLTIAQQMLSAETSDMDVTDLNACNSLKH